MLSNPYGFNEGLTVGKKQKGDSNLSWSHFGQKQETCHDEFLANWRTFLMHRNVEMDMLLVLSIFCELNGQYGQDNSTWMNRICDFYSCRDLLKSCVINVILLKV